MKGLENSILDFLYNLIKVRLVDTREFPYYIALYITHKQLTFYIAFLLHRNRQHIVF